MLIVHVDPSADGWKHATVLSATVREFAKRRKWLVGVRMREAKNFGLALMRLRTRREDNLRFLRSSASYFLYPESSVKFVSQPGRRFWLDSGTADWGGHFHCAPGVAARWGESRV